MLVVGHGDHGHREIPELPQVLVDAAEDPPERGKFFLEPVLLVGRAHAAPPTGGWPVAQRSLSALGDQEIHPVADPQDVHQLVKARIVARGCRPAPNISYR